MATEKEYSTTIDMSKDMELDEMEKSPDESTGTEFTEHSTNGYSDDLLSITGKGVWGLLERVPLVVKLVIMCIISLLGMTVLAIFLLVIEGKTLKNVSATRRFALTATSVGQLLTALQDEREWVNTAVYTASSGANFSDFNEVLQDSFRRTDELIESVYIRKIAPYVGKEYDETSTAYRIAQKAVSFNSSVYGFQDSRAGLKDMSVSEVPGLSLSYTSAVSDLLDILSFFMQDATTPTTMSYSGFLRIYEQQQSIKIQAQAAITSGFVTFASYTSTTVALSIRETLISHWIANSPSVIVNRYNKMREERTDLLEFLSKAEVALTTYRDGFRFMPIPPIFTLSLWTANSTQYNQDLKQIQAQIVEKYNKENDDDLRFATSLIISIALIIAIFFALSIVASITMSFTIVGPWRRLNHIQRAAISKFVPQSFLKLIGFSNIADVALGKFQQRDLTMLVVDIRDFAKKTAGMKAEEVFKFLNSYLNHVGPVIRKNAGFISRYNSNGFVAMFRNPKKGLKTSIEIQAMMRGYNSMHEQEFPEINVSSGLHAGKMLIGTVGEDERLEASVVSNESHITELLEDMAAKYRANILMTRDSLDLCGKFAAKYVQTRNFGSILVDNSTTGEQEFVPVVEVLNQDTTNKTASKASFERGLALFEAGRYSESIQSFTEASETSPDDVIASMYKRKAQQMVDQCKSLATTLSISNILRDASLLEGFEMQARNEHSTENIMLWKEIEAFKDIITADQRRENALRIQRDFFSMDGEYTININESLKQQIGAQLSRTDIDVPSTLFNELQKELEYLMADTCKRFKEGNAFSSFLMQSKLYGPQKPSLQNL